MQEKKDLTESPDYSTPLSEVMKEEKKNILTTEKDIVKKYEECFQIPTDEEMMEILNPNYVY